MKARLTKYRRILKQAKAEIQSDLLEYFDSCEYPSKSKSVQVIKVTSASSIADMYTMQGFYIILSDIELDDNECTFELNKQRAIYRGHSYNVKNRIMSHLFNTRYKNELDGETVYTACLKIEDGVNGVNVDEEPYVQNKWTVIVHKMLKSDKVTREQAEAAFDQKYKKPCKSREK
jgi:hypothetical protein